MNRGLRTLGHKDIFYLFFQGPTSGAGFSGGPWINGEKRCASLFTTSTEDERGMVQSARSVTFVSVCNDPSSVPLIAGCIVRLD